MPPPQPQATTRRSTEGPPPRPAGITDRLASTRLTLTLLAFLTIAMAVGTVMPQGAPREVYVRLFGTVGSPVVLALSLDHAFGAWWFAGAFGLLALNLVACGVRRSAALLHQRERFAAVTEAQVLRKPRQARWEVVAPPGEAALATAEALRSRGYTAASSVADGEAGVVATRGRLAPWGPVLAHFGVALVLVGAAWGRLPRHAYHAEVAFQPGESFIVPKGRPFSVRLLESGLAHDRRGNPTEYWAKVEAQDRGRLVRRVTIRPNHPLRYRHVTVTLTSLAPAGHVVSARQGREEALIPVVRAPDGTVDAMRSGGMLGQPPRLIAVIDLWEGADGAAARLVIDATGRQGHQWQEIGWVDARGRDYQGVHLRLARTPPLAQLSFDRDVGVPLVWTGFALVTLGALIAAGLTRRSVVALAVPSGPGCRVLIGAGGRGVAQDVEAVAERFRGSLEGAGEEA